MNAESSDRLADAIEALTDRLQVIQDVLDDVRVDLQHALHNPPEQYLPITRMSKDPSSKNWKVTRGRPVVAETIDERVMCAECDAEAPLADGIRRGWTEIAPHEHGFVGLCPAHRAWEYAESDAHMTAKSIVDQSPSSAADPDRPVLAGAGSHSQEKTLSGPIVMCDVCSKESTVDEAKKTGWTDVARWKGGDTPFLGICPDHGSDAPENALQAPPNATTETLKVSATPTKFPRSRLFD